MAHTAKQSRKGIRFLPLFILIAILLIAVFVFFRLKSLGSWTERMQVMQSDPLTAFKAARFSDAQKDSVKKAIAGFWMLDIAAGDSGVLSLFDHIELKTNGIIWRVTLRTLRLPSGDTTRITSITQAYANPFSRDKGDVNGIVSEVRIIREVIIRDGDTCIGPENTDEIWGMAGDGNRFMLEGQAYAKYNGDVTKFFPAGAISVVDMPYGEGKQDLSPQQLWEKTHGKKAAPAPVVQGATGIFAVRHCPGPVDGPAIIRTILNSDCAKLSPASGNADNIGAIIEKYYKPMCLVPIVGRGSIRPSQSLLEVTYAVRADGSVDKVRVRAARGRKPDIIVTSLVMVEMKLWKLFPRPAGSTTYKGSFTF